MNTPPNSSAAYWEPYVAEWQHSGLSQIQYCTQKNLSLHKFRYWRDRLEQMAARTNAKAIIPIFQTTTPQVHRDDLIVKIDRLVFGPNIGNTLFTVTIEGSIPLVVLQQIGQACASVRNIPHVQA